MKKYFFILTLILAASSCDYREYPQEQEWKENIREMEKEKEQDPRNFDEEMEQEKRQREVNANDIIWTPANQ